jgi:hypothetical protein
VTVLILAEHHLRTLRTRLTATVRQTLATVGEALHPQRQYATDAEVATGWAQAMAEGDPQPGSQSKCPTCTGRRCYYHRHGLHCPGQELRLVEPTGTYTAMHRSWTVAAHPVPAWWSPLSTAVRRSLAPTAWSVRLGVPPRGALA